MAQNKQNSSKWSKPSKDSREGPYEYNQAKPQDALKAGRHRANNSASPIPMTPQLPSSTLPNARTEIH